MDMAGIFNVGTRNQSACKEILRGAGVTIQREEMGGIVSRTVRLEVSSGALHWYTGAGPHHVLSFKKGV
jgi:chemotaxis protein CheD